MNGQWPTEQASADLLKDLHGIRQHSSKGSAVDNGIFPLAVLDHIIGQVEEVKLVSGISWRGENRRPKQCYYFVQNNEHSGAAYLLLKDCL